MILIFSHTTSPRLQYISHFLFTELMHEEVRISIDSEEFKSFQGTKINYSDTDIPGTQFQLKPHPLLFEEGIRRQEANRRHGSAEPYFFFTTDSFLPFDIFAASFYLLSRYEEYLPHNKDMYGRFAYENSAAYGNGFLNKPVINTWAKELAVAINLQPSTFTLHPSFLPTYDIDIAYSYLHKGFLRNAAGALRSPFTIMERIKVATGKKQDPFDTYELLNGLHEQYGLKPLYFFLVPEKNGIYDKNILPHKDAMWGLVKQHAKKYTIGLHPSWQSGDKPSLLETEKQQLEAMAEKPVNISRQHYIRFNLPDTYRRLISAGIKDEYSMGYGSINGFRASVASSFNWYDLEKEEITSLRIHPFCYMEANSFYEQHNTPEQALKEMVRYHEVCKDAGGTFISIWHNHFLGTDTLYKGWKECYLKFLSSL